MLTVWRLYWHIWSINRGKQYWTMRDRKYGVYSFQRIIVNFFTFSSYPLDLASSSAIADKDLSWFECAGQNSPSCGLVRKPILIDISSAKFSRCYWTIDRWCVVLLPSRGMSRKWVSKMNGWMDGWSLANKKIYKPDSPHRGGSGSNNRKRYLQKKFQYWSLESTSSKLCSHLYHQPAAISKEITRRL